MLREITIKQKLQVTRRPEFGVSLLFRPLTFRVLLLLFLPSPANTGAASATRAGARDCAMRKLTIPLDKC